MTARTPSKTKAPAKPEADLKPQSAPCNPEPESSLVAQKADSAAHCADTQEPELTTHSQSPVIMNTTLDLLEDSDADLLIDPQDRVDDVSEQAGFLLRFQKKFPSTPIKIIFFVLTDCCEPV